MDSDYDYIQKSNVYYNEEFNVIFNVATFIDGDGNIRNINVHHSHDNHEEIKLAFFKGENILLGDL